MTDAPIGGLCLLFKLFFDELAWHGQIPGNVQAYFHPNRPAPRFEKGRRIAVSIQIGVVGQLVRCSLCTESCSNQNKLIQGLL